MTKYKFIPRIAGERAIFEWLCVFITLMFIMSVRAQTALVGGMVTGTDGGNWLAIGQEMLGSGVKAADVSYAPLIPFILTCLSFLFGKLFSLSIIYIVSSVSLSFTIYYLVRQHLGFLAALLCAVTQIYVGLNYEIIAWGGYPQIVSQSFILMACYWIARFSDDRSLKYLYLFSSAALLACSTWLPGSLILFIAVSFICALSFKKYNFVAHPKFLKHILINAGFSIFILAFISRYYFNSLDLVQTKGWNLHGYRIEEFNVVLETIFREWMVLGSIFTIGIGFLFVLMAFVLVKIDCAGPLRRTFIGILLASLVVYILTQELRALSLFIIVSWSFCVTLAVSNITQIRDRYSTTKGVSESRIYIRVIFSVLLFMTVFGQILLGHGKSDEIFSYYRVLDRNVLESLDWMKENTKEPSLIISGHNHNSFPYIWWLEGYSEIPAYSYSDVRSFNFIGERDQVNTANRIISQLTTNSFDFKDLEVEFIYVFLDKFSDQYRYRIQSKHAQSIFENEKIVVYMIERRM